MLRKQKYSLEDNELNEEALLAFSNHSGTELDYEISDSLLDSDKRSLSMEQVKSDTFSDSTTLPKSHKTIESLKVVLRENLISENECRSQMGTKAIGDFDINEYDYKSTSSDVLDLQCMADKFSEAAKRKCIEKIVFETREFNYNTVTRVDKLLEEAYTILYKFYDKLDRSTRASLMKSISVLKDLPHTDVPIRPYKAKIARVINWLNHQTSHPEPEICGFTTQDPFQVRKFVTNSLPRLSTSDTNVILGKRKRSFEYPETDDVTSVRKSSSDTRMYVDTNWSKSSGSVKRRRVRVV